MTTPVDPNWTLEWLKIAQGLFGALLGGALVLLANWQSDRRKFQAEAAAKENQERALLTGMFAVRNHVIARLNDYQSKNGGLLSQLEPLRTAQAYVQRLIDKAPSASESLMIVVIEIGLKIDSLMATIDRRKTDPGLKGEKAFALMVSRDVGELEDSFELFDLIAGSRLTSLTEDDLK